jgi:hypothetical protein
MNAAEYIGQQLNYASLKAGQHRLGRDVVAATGRLLINKIGTGTYLDDPVFHHCELTEMCVL